MARDIWFISDTHFGHQRIIELRRPQFAGVDVGQMDEALVDAWNAVIRNDDLVYHLGDFAVSAKHAKLIRPKLNGTIRLAVGNHDDVPALAQSGLFQDMFLWKKFKEYEFTASHIPLGSKQFIHCGRANVHGHVHGVASGLEPYHIDMSVEATAYAPVHLEDLLSRVQNR